jgi:sporulation protein YlmC with PRC-barrel domain
MTAGAGPRPPRRLRLQELMGRQVVDTAGRRVGRVVDVVAEPWGDELRVTALLVGPSAWAARFGPLPGVGGRQVPWQDIVGLSPRITIRGTDRAG